MCDLIIYLRKGLGDKSRDHTDVQSLNLIASIRAHYTPMFALPWQCGIIKYHFHGSEMANTHNNSNNVFPQILGPEKVGPEKISFVKYQQVDWLKNWSKNILSPSQYWLHIDLQDV